MTAAERWRLWRWRRALQAEMRALLFVGIRIGPTRQDAGGWWVVPFDWWFEGQRRDMDFLFMPPFDARRAVLARWHMMRIFQQCVGWPNDTQALWRSGAR